MWQHGCEPWGYYVEWNKSDKDNTVNRWSHLYVESKKQTHGNRVVWQLPRGWGGWTGTDEGGQRVQTSSFEMNDFWGSNVQESDNS